MARRYLTAGESQGPVLVGILDGLPAGIPLSGRDLAPRMKRRMGGYGRGKPAAGPDVRPAQRGVGRLHTACDPSSISHSRAPTPSLRQASRPSAV